MKLRIGILLVRQKYSPSPLTLSKETESRNWEVLIL
jgi:hypothetical protein